MSDITENTVEDITENKNETKTSEEYAYLDRGGFSSEKFKIELRGLPKFYGIVVSLCITLLNNNFQMFN